MNTSNLATAYQLLFDAVQRITEDAPLDPDQRTDVDWTLCHIALSDQILTHAVRSLRSSRTETSGKLVVDNHPAMDPVAIGTMTASTTHDERVLAVRHHATELIAELDQVSDQAAQAPLVLRFHDKTGQHVGDADMMWVDLIELRAHQHIPAHTTRLDSYLSAQPAQPE